MLALWTQYFLMPLNTDISLIFCHISYVVKNTFFKISNSLGDLSRGYFSRDLREIMSLTSDREFILITLIVTANELLFFLPKCIFVTDEIFLPLYPFRLLAWSSFSVFLISNPITTIHHHLLIEKFNSAFQFCCRFCLFLSLLSFWKILEYFNFYSLKCPFSPKGMLII